LAQEGSYEGSTSLSLQHVLAGCSTAATPRPPQPDLLRYGSFYNFGGDILLNSVYVHIYTHHV